MEQIKVYFVAEHAFLRSVVAAVLRKNADFEVIDETHELSHTLERCKELMPDIALIDTSLVKNNVSFIHRLKKELPHLKIMLLAVEQGSEDVFEAFKAGARAYLSTKVTPKNLSEALHALHRDKAVIPKQFARKILDEFEYSGTLQSGKKSPALTSREKKILEALEQGYGIRQIAFSLKISENAFQNNVRNILEKLHLEYIIQTALRSRPTTTR